MSGEMEIITTLAKDNVLKGDSEINAIENARKQFEFALDEALNYDFSKNNRKRSKIKKSNEELIKEGDFDTLLKQNMGLVHKVADRYKNDKYYEDMVQECIASMYYAYLEFDASKGFKFSTFAYKSMWHNSYVLFLKLHGSIRRREWKGTYDKNGKREYYQRDEIVDTVSYDNKMNMNSDSDKEDTFLNNIESVEKGYNFIEEKDWLEYMVQNSTKVTDMTASKFDIREIIQMRLNGHLNGAIAEKLNTNENTISRYIIRYRKYLNDNWGRLTC